MNPFYLMLTKENQSQIVTSQDFANPFSGLEIQVYTRKTEDHDWVKQNRKAKADWSQLVNQMDTSQRWTGSDPVGYRITSSSNWIASSGTSIVTSAENGAGLVTFTNINDTTYWLDESDVIPVRAQHDHWAEANAHIRRTERERRDAQREAERQRRRDEEDQANRGQSWLTRAGNIFR